MSQLKHDHIHTHTIILLLQSYAHAALFMLLLTMTPLDVDAVADNFSVLVNKYHTFLSLAQQQKRLVTHMGSEKTHPFAPVGTKLRLPART